MLYDAVLSAGYIRVPAVGCDADLHHRLPAHVLTAAMPACCAVLCHAVLTAGYIWVPAVGCDADLPHRQLAHVLTAAMPACCAVLCHAVPTAGFIWVPAVGCDADLPHRLLAPAAGPEYTAGYHRHSAVWCWKRSGSDCRRGSRASAVQLVGTRATSEAINPQLQLTDQPRCLS
jgi:hypothetical protein